MLRNRDEMLPVMFTEKMSEVKLIVRRDFLHGIILISMQYKIGKGNFCNTVGQPKLKFGWLDNDGNMKLSRKEFATQIIPHPDIMANFTLAMEYFAYTRDLLLQRPAHPNYRKGPISFDDFLKIRKE